MNTFNRVLIVIALLVAIALCSVFCVVPAAFNQLARQMGALAQYLGTLRPIARIGLGALFAAVIDIVLVLVVVLELQRARPRSIRVERVTGGEVSLSTASIVDRLRYEIDQLPGILRVKPRVAARGGGVTVNLDVDAAGPIDVPQKAERIVETARLVIEEKMGLKLAHKPKVALRTMALQQPLPGHSLVSQEPGEEPPFAPSDGAIAQDAER